jgi:hypothetical protein
VGHKPANVGLEDIEWCHGVESTQGIIGRIWCQGVPTLCKRARQENECYLAKVPYVFFATLGSNCAFYMQCLTSTHDNTSG